MAKLSKSDFFVFVCCLLFLLGHSRIGETRGGGGGGRKKTNSITPKCPPPTWRPLQDSAASFLKCCSAVWLLPLLRFRSPPCSPLLLRHLEMDLLLLCDWLLLWEVVFQLISFFMSIIHMHGSHSSRFCGKIATKHFQVVKVLIRF